MIARRDWEDQLLAQIGENERPINRAESAYGATLKAANDPCDDTGWAEPMTNAVLAAVEAALEELAEQHEPNFFVRLREAIFG